MSLFGPLGYPIKPRPYCFGNGTLRSWRWNVMFWKLEGKVMEAKQKVMEADTTICKLPLTVHSKQCFKKL